MSYFSTNKKLGILGGGQLGKMMLYTTRKWDITTHVLDPSPAAPSRLACDYFECGDFRDYQTAFDFGKDLDIVTFEIEQVNLKALEDLEKKGVKVFPSAANLNIIQNKCRQKDFYAAHQIPTAPYSNYSSLKALIAAVESNQQEMPFVWKAAEMGYDGNGVKIVRQREDLNSLGEGACLAEKIIPFTHELAVIVCGSVDGKKVTYPVVEMEFHPEANQVEYVLSPARISDELTKKAEAIALQVAEALQNVGLLAVELFLTAAGEILVNEVAPRPHNSGHLTLETAYTDQFEQHLRAVLELPLGKTDNKVSGVMVNLVGAEGYDGPVYYENINEVLSFEGVTPHIYGKKETRPFRKMGHVTIVDPALDKARERAEEVKKLLTVRTH